MRDDVLMLMRKRVLIEDWGEGRDISGVLQEI
jgi:hypothetical protein